MLDYTQRMTARGGASGSPTAIYEGSDYADTDGFSDDPVYVRLKLMVRGDRITVDLTGSDPVTVGRSTRPMANTASAIYYSLKFFLNPDAPPNAGLYRQIDIEFPEEHLAEPVLAGAHVRLHDARLVEDQRASIWQALSRRSPTR